LSDSDTDIEFCNLLHICGWTDSLRSYKNTNTSPRPQKCQSYKAFTVELLQVVILNYIT